MGSRKPEAGMRKGAEGREKGELVNNWVQRGGRWDVGCWAGGGRVLSKKNAMD